MAWNHGLSRAVLRVYTRVLGGVYARGARARGIEGGQTGIHHAITPNIRGNSSWLKNELKAGLVRRAEATE